MRRTLCGLLRRRGLVERGHPLAGANAELRLGLFDLAGQLFGLNVLFALDDGAAELGDIIDAVGHRVRLYASARTRDARHAVHRLRNFLVAEIILVFQQVNAKQDAAHGDEDVRDVENGEPVQKFGCELEHVDDVAADNAVEAIADAAGHDHDERPAAEAALYDVVFEQPDHERDKGDRENDEQPPRTRIPEDAEGRAGIVDVGDVDNVGDKAARSAVDVERDVHARPVFHCLIADQDEQHGDNVGHRSTSCG